MQMGNCVGHGSPMNPAKGSSGVYGDAEKVLGKTEGDSLFNVEKDAAASSTAEVKIKLSKKQVADLLGRVDIHGMSTVEILAHLILVSGESKQRNHRSWRPMLKSIPEVNQVGGGED